MKHPSRTLGAMIGIAALVTAAACGGDKSNGPDNSPASVTANGTFPASVVIASPVNPAPSVIVKNSSGAPLPNVRVTFVVTAGGGTVTGGSQLTDANGIATVAGWTVGSTPGPQTLTATAGGKTATFSINATNTCVLSGSIDAGGTVNGNLTTTTCGMGDGTAAQSWTFQPAAQTTVSFAMHPTGSPTFDTVLLLHRNTFSGFNHVIAGNDDDPSGLTSDSRLNVILAPGSYVLTANNYEPGMTGSFTITAESWTGDFVNCGEAYVTPGITTSQAMDGSCHYNNGALQNVEPIGVFLAQGQQVQIDMSSTVFDPQLDFYAAGSSTPVMQDNNGGGGTSARITYTAPTEGIYVIVATAPTAGQTGAYALSVTSLSGAPTSPAATASATTRAPRAIRTPKTGQGAFGWPANPWARAE